MGQKTVTIDVAGLGQADVYLVDALARLSLALRRSHLVLRLENAPDGLREMSRFMGLDHVLGVDSEWHSE